MKVQMTLSESNQAPQNKAIEQLIKQQKQLRGRLLIAG